MDPQTTSQPDDLNPTATTWLARNGLNLLLIAAGVVMLNIWFGPETLFALALVVLGLGFMIFIHELGHFVAAKWCDVHVETFSIGFGPAIPGCQWQRGETTYKIAMIPLGGYVKMVGENPDADEVEDDPRSFKNKTVGQRMLIISAGVIMNVICGFVCFMIVYSFHGRERPPGVIGTVEAGSPAYERGMQRGQEIKEIGSGYFLSAKDPYFDDLQIIVALSGWDEPVPITFGFPGQRPVSTEIIPRRDEKDSRPMIGVAPAKTLELWPKRYAGDREVPVIRDSAAARAEPPLQLGDTIIATTDPRHPDQIKPLPSDPRNPGGAQLDFFAFQDRMHELAGEKVTVRVRRADGAVADIQLPPQYIYRLGLRMKMGRVAKVRSNSPAQRAEVIGSKRADKSPGLKPNDIIDAVIVTRPEDGLRMRWQSTRPRPDSEERWARNLATAAVGHIAGIEDAEAIWLTDEGIEIVQVLDPVRLPFDLDRWARKQAVTPKPDWSVRLRVRRENPETHKMDDQLTLRAEWQHSGPFEEAVTLQLSSPMDLPGLGLAYYVDTTIQETYPNSPAAEADLKPGDVIKAVRFYDAGAKPDDPPKPDRWMELGPEQWAHVFWVLQGIEVHKVDLRIEREGPARQEISLVAKPDESWPADQRGLIFMNDMRLQKGDTFSEALALAWRDTYLSIPRIYMQIRSLLNRRLAAENIGGPIRIAETAYRVASQDVFFYIWLLGMLNINLAVINFLPIPVLDGGHMVFLIYEKLRGKPPSESVRVAATYVGVILILSLLVFATYNDISGLLKRW